MNNVKAPPQRSYSLAFLQSTIEQFFRQSDYAVEAVYLLGSAGTGQMRRDSDIDIALLTSAPDKITVQDRLSLASELEVQLGRIVDIGLISSRNLVYTSEAILRGTRIDIGNRDLADQLETRYLGCYMQFRLDRHEVEEAYDAA